jgi:hypothetical protein
MPKTNKKGILDTMCLESLFFVSISQKKIEITAAHRVDRSPNATKRHQ